MNSEAIAETTKRNATAIVIPKTTLSEPLRLETLASDISPPPKAPPTPDSERCKSTSTMSISARTTCAYGSTLTKFISAFIIAQHPKDLHMSFPSGIF